MAEEYIYKFFALTGVKNHPVVTADGLGTSPRQVDGQMDRLTEEGTEPGRMELVRVQRELAGWADKWMSGWTDGQMGMETQMEQPRVAPGDGWSGRGPSLAAGPSLALLGPLSISGGSSHDSGWADKWMDGWKTGGNSMRDGWTVALGQQVGGV